MNKIKFPPHRYLGLELSGAKNPKTTLVVLEYYPRENKVFVLDVYDYLGSSKDRSADENLIQLIENLTHEYDPQNVRVGVNIPLQLPPCLKCTKKSCITQGTCTDPAVKWMEALVKKAIRSRSSNIPKIKDFTPYTQRPIELWLRYHVLPTLQPRLRFEIDETLGGNKAPLTARMQFLKRRLKNIQLIETLPKLTIATLYPALGLSLRELNSYRDLEKGALSRSNISHLHLSCMHRHLINRSPLKFGF